MTDIVERIRRRFPNPKYADDGLLANEAADEIERLEGRLTLAQDAMQGYKLMAEIQAGGEVSKAATMIVEKDTEIERLRGSRALATKSGR